MADEIKQAKLRSVYNAIDSGNYKSAIKLCGRKDISSWDLTKALLSYCYANVMRTTEALSLAYDILNRKPTSPTILTPLKLTFKILHDWNAITVMYEGALEKDSTNLDHAHELFCCYARNFQPEKMKQLAQSLYRATSRINYLFWSVASMLHMENVNSTILLLSERMVKKVLCNDHSNIQPGAEEIHLLVDVIRRQGRDEEALQMLDELIARPLSADTTSSKSKNIHVNDGNDFEMNPNLIKMTNLQLKRLRCELLLKLNKIDDHDIELQAMLEDYPDDWVSLKDLEILRFNNASNKEEAVISHQKWLINHESLNPRIRGPLLAQLSLLIQLNSLPSSWTKITVSDQVTVPLPNFGEGINREMIHHIVVYIHRFCSKQCCYSDLKPYLIHLTDKSSSDDDNSRKIIISLIKYCISLASSYEQTLKEKIATSKDNIDSILSSLSVDDKDGNISTATAEIRNEYLKLVTSICKLHQIAFFLENRLEMEGDEEKLNISRNLFWLTWPLVQGGIGGEREVQPCDEFGLLVSTIHRGKCHTLQKKYDSVCKSETFEKIFSVNRDYLNLFQSLFQWISDLEQMSTTSQYNYMFPLEKMCPYRSLAAGKQCLDLYGELNVRHIQLDSMTYLILPVLMENGLLGQAHRIYNAIGRFHKSAKRDTNEMLARSLQYGNYMKSFELANFNMKIKKSLAQALYHSEAVWLQIVGGNITRQTINEEHDTFLYDVLFGNKSSQSKRELIDFINHYSSSGSLAPDMDNEDEIHDNSDYDLLIRLDGATDDDITKEKKLRKIQLRDRVLSAQALINVCAVVLNEDWDKFRDLDKSLDIITKSYSTPQMKWSQALQCPSFMEITIDALLKSMHSACSIVILASADTDVVAKEMQPQIQSSIQSFSQHIESFKVLTTDSAIYFHNENQKDSSMESPQLVRSEWIHSMSSFCMKCLPLCTIILGCITQFHPSIKVFKKKGKSTSNPLNKNISRMINLLRDLVSGMITSVDAILALKSKKCNFDVYANLFESQASSNQDTQSDEEWKEQLQRVLSSHFESCDEISRILKRFQTILTKLS